MYHAGIQYRHGKGGFCSGPLDFLAKRPGFGSIPFVDLWNQVGRIAVTAICGLSTTGEPQHPLKGIDHPVHIYSLLRAA